MEGASLGAHWRSSPPSAKAFAMLSVLVLDAKEPAGLAVTLSSLVGGVVEGVVRDVVVVDPAGADALKVADHAGCTVRSLSELRLHATGLKGDWVLVIEAGERLPGNWPERAIRHVEDQAGRGAPRAGVIRRSRGFALPWAGLLSRRGGIVLVPKAHLASRLASGGTPAQAARGLRRVRLRPRED